MNDLDTMRATALRQLDRTERWFKLTIFAAALFEGFFLLAILWLADFKNQLHLLIVSCTGIIYMPVLLGLIALGVWMNRCTLRVLARLDQ
jgi:hypothetical protein